MTRTTKTELERLRAYRRAHFEQITARTEPFAHGVAVFTPAHPTKWDLNLLVVEDATGVSADELIAEAERLQAPAGLRHRKVELLHGGDGLVDGFAKRRLDRRAGRRDGAARRRRARRRARGGAARSASRPCAG